jgi:hypothetical protein
MTITISKNKRTMMNDEFLQVFFISSNNIAKYGIQDE